MAKKGLSNSEYWKRRLIEHEERSQEIDDHYLALMKQELAEYQRNVIRDIEAFYARYATDYKMSLADARQYLTNNELKEFQNVTLESFRKMGQSPYIDQRLRDALAYRHRISRKEALLTEIEAKTIDLFGKKDGLVDYTFKNMGQVYGSQKLELARGMADIGIEVRKPILDLETIKNKLRVNWSGKNLSETIWGHSDKLYDDIAEVLEKGFLGDYELSDIIDQVVKRTGVAWPRAETLVRTESNAFNSMGAVDEMKHQGIKKYRNVVTMDAVTSGVCQQVYAENKSYSIDEYEIGLTAPPMDDVFDMWEEELEETIEQLDSIDDDADFMVQSRLFEAQDEDGNAIRINAKRVDSTEYDIWTQGKTKRFRDTVEMLMEVLPELESNYDLPRMVVANSSKFGGLAAYNHTDDILYVNNLLHSQDAVENLLEDRYFAARNFKDIIIHELAHKKHWDAVKGLQKSRSKMYNSLEEAKQVLDDPIRKHITTQMQNDILYLRSISNNAFDAFDGFDLLNSINETVAEMYVLGEYDIIDSILYKLIKEAIENDEVTR